MSALPHENCYRVPDTRLIAGEYPFSADPLEGREKLRAILDCGATWFVDLTEEGERGLLPYAQVLREELAVRGLELGVDVGYTRHPIRDIDVPTAERMQAILDEIESRTANGHTLYVHCWGGVGRTGTVIGCLLARSGLDYDAVVARLRELRQATRKRDRECPEVPAQHDLLRRRAAAGGRP